MSNTNNVQFAPYQTLGLALRSLSHGKFVSPTGEHCQISTYYERNTKKIKVYFEQPDGKVTRYAISTTSDKKVLDLLNNGNFINQ